MLPVEEEMQAHSDNEIFGTLHEKGYVVVEGNSGQRHAIWLLQKLGSLVPQYSGALEHEVTYRAGFDNKAYSQSNNTILAHTEAPGWLPSPRYLALYCHRQARCGGGHTDLLDCQKLVELLNEESLAILRGSPLFFPGPEGGVNATLLGKQGNREVLRFSFNLLTTGEYDPTLSAQISMENLPLGKAGHDLAHLVNSLFQDKSKSILVPDDGLLIWDNHRMLHARSNYEDKNRHLVRYWVN